MEQSTFATRLTITFATALVAGCGGLFSKDTSKAEATASAAKPGETPNRVFLVSPELMTPPPPPPRAKTASPERAVAAGSYTQGLPYGDLLFVSGQIGMDTRTSAFNEAAGIEEQTRQVMENIRQVLEAHRLTMANVVSATIYLRSMADLQKMDAAYEPHFRSHLPARSIVEVAQLPRNAAVEIAVVAGR